MNQLLGKYVNVVLGVQCGRGMDFIKNSVSLTGNFNGRILESDKIPADANPAFNTELVWEVDKKELRKIRSANQPLRVECLSTDTHNRRERVGFTLLSLRSAQIIPRKDADQHVKFLWQKLIGCQADKKKSHPELYLSLVLRDHLLNDEDVSNNSLSVIPYISEEDTNIVNGNISQFPLQYLDNGCIHIGDEENAAEIFQLNILIKTVMNLDTLLPEILVFQQSEGQYYLSFKILGISIKTKPFQKEFHNNITLNEKIVFTLVSNRESLTEVFRLQTVSVSFYHGPDQLGIAELALVDIFEEKNLRGFFKLPSQNGIIPYGCTEKSPYIEVKAGIEEKIGDSAYADIIEKPKPRTIFSNMSKKENMSENEAPKSNRIEENPIKLQGDHRNIPSLTESVDGIVLEQLPLTSRSLRYNDSYQKYVIQVKLRSIIWLMTPNDTKVMYKFFHPRSPSCISILTEMKESSEEIILNNLEVKIAYISCPDMIEKLLSTWYPRFILTDDREYPLCLEHSLNVNCKQSDIEYEVILRTVKNEPLAKVMVKIWMKSVDFEDNDDYEHLYLQPVIVDEIITIREVAELEKWRKHIRVSFEEELERIKDLKIKELEEEWKTKKADLEEQLSKAVDRCKKLQNDLQMKVAFMRIEKSIQRNEHSNKIYSEIFGENWKKHCDGNTRGLIEELSRSQRDNIVLKILLTEQKEKLSEFERSTLTKAQTNNLLQELKTLEERYEEVQRAKKYFKEQWISSCLEIHEIKADELNSLQTEIKKSNEELSVNNLNLK